MLVYTFLYVLPGFLTIYQDAPKQRLVYIQKHQVKYPKKYIPTFCFLGDFLFLSLSGAGSGQGGFRCLQRGRDWGAWQPIVRLVACRGRGGFASNALASSGISFGPPWAAWVLPWVAKPQPAWLFCVPIDFQQVHFCSLGCISDTHCTCSECMLNRDLSVS